VWTRGRPGLGKKASNLAGQALGLIERDERITVRDFDQLGSSQSPGELLAFGQWHDPILSGPDH
jgi:hypothetical protein